MKKIRNLEVIGTCKGRYMNKVEKIKELLKEAYELYKELFESDKEEINKFIDKGLK